MTVTQVGIVGSATSTTNGANSLSGVYGQTPTAGNLLVARVAFSAVTSVTAVTTVTSGWTKQFDVVAAATTTAVFTKTAVGSDTSPVFTGTSSGTTVMTSVITEHLGADANSPLDPGYNSYSGTTATAVSLSHSTAVLRTGGSCLTMYSIRRNTAIAQTGPPGSGFTADYTDGASLQRNHAYGDHETAAPAQGATPNESFTISAAPEVQSGVIFVIQPVAAPHALISQYGGFF